MYNPRTLTKVSIVGDFSKKGKKLIGRNIELIIATRTNPSRLKPPHFLLLVRPDGKREYISSLYPTDNTNLSFRLDWLGRAYTLKINLDSTAKIERP